MAHVYVRSAAAGAGTGADWTNAYTTLGAAFTAKAAGDNFWVADDHAETAGATKTLTSPGTEAAPCTVMCVNRAGSVPPVSADLRTTATITTTGAFGIMLARTAHYYGITFSGGTGATTVGITIGDGAVPHTASFKSCALKKLGTSGDSGAIKIDNGVFVLWDNVTCTFGAAIDAITSQAGGKLRWINTATPVAGTFPNTLFYNFNGQNTMVEGVDFSAAGFSGKTLFGANSAIYADSYLIGCKTHASLTVAAVPAGYGLSNVISINNDSAGTNYRHAKKSYAGEHYVETTIVRTGGAGDGVTPLSWRIDTTANAKWVAPFETLPMAIKNNTTGANVTVTVYGIWGGGAVPLNDEIWIEVSYMGASGSPLATINTANTKADYLAAGANQGTDTSTWGGSTTKFKMAVTLSSPQPQLRGPIYVTVKAAKASSTFYVDPKIVLS